MSDEEEVYRPSIGDEYFPNVSAAQYMKVPNGYGEHVKRLAESAHDTVHRLHHRAMEKRRFSEDVEEEVLDAEIRRFVTREVPEAFEDIGSHIQQAREYERDIAEDRFFGESTAVEWGLSQDERPDEEQDFLENYRVAEGHYRSLFEALDNQVGEDTLVEFVEEEYGIDMIDVLPDVPEPRPDVR